MIFFNSHTLISHSLQVDDVDIGPYAYKNNQWVGYDTVNYAKKKANYIIEKDLGGAMFWETSTDDFNVKNIIYLPTYIQLFNTKLLPHNNTFFIFQNRCGNGKYPIIKSVSDIVNP